jgi:phage/plasmid-like protein (TIGR03299 family)
MQFGTDSDKNSTSGASIEEWRDQAGMNWVVEESPLYFQTTNPQGFPYKQFPNRKVLYRSDTMAPLSVVGKNFNVVQPAEVLEFFRDLTEQHGMVLSTAGCLFGGSRFWALAETGCEAEITKGDIVKGNLLFVTSVDGTLSNTAKFVSTRVVCNNTLSVAMKERGRVMVRKSHRGIWDPTKTKIDLGLIDSSWNSFMANLRRLSDRKMNDTEVKTFFKKTFFDPKLEENDQTNGTVDRVNSLMSLYSHGAGAEYAYGTAFGALNAITNLFTHGTSRQRIPDRKFWGAFFDNDRIKDTALSNLLAMC